ncbi:GIY-YIG nuclease family protein [Bulleidia sp. zg-1006]|uniref:GIY-YIG nuclease family protein n=1 Tax=Bulleidia sp. zg-1006 TaxID=2806552 RepID=UPI001EEE03B8|nr:GIY-YIG nuclease family protein [Bulleidia sp. zg-1006]
MNYVYILECEDGSFYTGWTRDIEKRFTSHCLGKGAKYTRSHPPKRIVYCEILSSKQDAMSREWHIKRLSHQAKEELVQSYQRTNEKRRKSMSNLKFYKCENCGKMMVQLNSEASACPAGMVELTTASQSGAVEKHQPVVTVNGNHYKVQVGEVAHVMTEEHLIESIVVEFVNGFRVFHLGVGANPEVEFDSEEKPVAVYEYCNLHGLWKESL